MTHRHEGPAGSTPVTVVLHTGGMYLASEKAVVERGLGARPDVLAVEANPVAQTSNVTYDPSRATVGDLRRSVEECGYQCAGQSVPLTRGSSILIPAACRQFAISPDGPAVLLDMYLPG